MPRYEVDDNGWWSKAVDVQHGRAAEKGGGYYQQPKGKGGAEKGKAKGKGKDHKAPKGKGGKGLSTKGKGYVREADAPPRGSYLVCGDDCKGWAYSDVAGATCRLCDKRWDWKAFWSRLAGVATGGDTQNAEGARPMETAEAPAPQVQTEPATDTAAEVTTAEKPVEVADSPSTVHASVMAKLKDCWKVVEKYDVQLKHESSQLVQMGGSLDTKIQAVKDQMQKMEAQATAIKKVEEERAVAFKAYTDREGERATVWNNCAASISTKVSAAFPPLSAQAAAYVSPATLELLQLKNIQSVASAEPRIGGNLITGSSNTVNERIITEIDLSNNNLTGTVWWGSYFKSPDLVRIDLSRNQLSGK